jgi:dethiobiotin synthetase
MADLVVTGTDTDVGKTVVAAAIILGLRQMGIRAVGFQPVESGLAPETPADSHVVLTVEALKRRNIPIRGIVLNARGEPPDLAEATNPVVLERLLPGLKVVTVPRHAPAPPLGVARGSVAAVMRLWPEPPGAIAPRR